MRAMKPPAWPGRRRGRPAPSAAAIPVALLAVALLAVAGCHGGGAAGSVAAPCASSPASAASPAAAGVAPSASGARASTAGVPAYYVALTEYASDAPYSPTSPPGGYCEPPIVVGGTFTGRVLATVPPPPGTGFTGVAGAADDRTFVVGTSPNGVPPGNPSGFFAAPRAWYLMRLSPGSAPGYRLARLPIPVTPSGTQVTGLALAPNGSELALALQPGALGHAPGQEVLRVYSMATGATLHSWYGPANAIFGNSAGIDSNTSLSWADGGRELAFNDSWPIASASGIVGTRDYQLRAIDLSRPGHDLLADSKPIWSTPEPPPVSPPTKSPLTCVTDLEITSDGSTVVCGAVGVLRDPGTDLNPPPGGCPRAPAWNDRAFLEHSAATGKLTDVIGTWRTSCLTIKPIALLWAGRPGAPLIGFMPDRTPGPDSETGQRIALFTAGGYQPLPDLPYGATSATTAW